MSTWPDYYYILSVSHTATQSEIKQAYRLASLATHPDRLPTTATTSERQAANLNFSEVADAYYTLSDPERRRTYDSRRPSSSSSSGGAGAGAGAGVGRDERPDPEHVFADVFEEMLRPQVERLFPLWTYLGLTSGAIIGFITGNLPGAAIGAYAGSKLGKVRDAKGKAVYQVFKDLGGEQKAEILKALASKVFTMAAGNVS